VLEVGSGRGGGASYLARYREPKKMVGVDFSPEAVAFCEGRYAKVPNVQFFVGDAEKLPFADACFDVVVNVESSHCYGNIGKFFGEVTRVLRPDGYFVYADLRTAAEMEELKALLSARGNWQILEEEDITAQVAAALKADDTRKRKMIAELVPSEWQPIFKEFAGVDGGKVCQGLEKRELLYSRFVFQRAH
jgi:ubiquinone/menaquinone biosynthesis C-methylase UbiE